MPKGKPPLTSVQIETDPPLDRPRGQGRHARVSTSPQYDMRASAGLHAAAGAHVARLSRPTAQLLAVVRLSRSAAAQGRRLRAGRPAGRACRSGSSRPRSRPTASCWPSPAARPAASAKCRSGTSPSRQAEALARPSATTRSTARAGRPNGKMVAFGCPDNTVRAIDAETGKQVLFSGAHNDWVLDTIFSVNSRSPDLGQPRHVDEADRSRHAAVHRQHHQHHARRAQGRPRSRSIGIRRRTNCWSAAPTARRRSSRCSATQARADRRQLQPDPRVSRACPAASSAWRFSPDGSRIAAGSSQRRHRRSPRLQRGRRRKLIWQARTCRRRHLRRRLQPRRQARSPPAASTARCACSTPPTGKLIKEFFPVAVRTNK